MKPLCNVFLVKWRQTEIRQRKRERNKEMEREGKKASGRET